MMKGKNVDFDAEKWKNEMTHPGFEPGTSALRSGVLTPTPQFHQGIWQKKLRESLFNALLWQNVANIKGGKFKQGKIQIFKGP